MLAPIVSARTAGKARKSTKLRAKNVEHIDKKKPCPRLLPTAVQDKGNFAVWLMRRKFEWRASRNIVREPSEPIAKDSPPRSVAVSPKPATLLSAAVVTPPKPTTLNPDNSSDVNRAVDVEIFV